MNTIEKVARAIHEKAYETRGKDRRRPDWVQVARAAIEAMREPTDYVAEAMSNHAANGYVDWRDLHGAMIDAALSGETAENGLRDEKR